MNKKTFIKFITKISFYLFIFLISLIIIFFAINVLIEPQIKKNLSTFNNISSSYWVRFKIFSWNLITFNPGKIYSIELSTVEKNIFVLYVKQFKWSCLICLLIFIFSFMIGNILGIFSAHKLFTTYDTVINILISFLGSLPILIIAILALVNAPIFGYPSQFLNERLVFVSLLVPILITSFPTMAIFFSKSRKKTIEILKSDYYLFSLSTGLSRTKLLNKIVLKELFISEINLFFVIYILLFTVSLLIERLFSIPGQSLLLSFAFSKGELDIIMFYFVFNFVLLSLILFINKIILFTMNPILREEKILFFKSKRGYHV
ncbi:ABC transporter permease subunit [Mycoplasmopsis opalescens]|uniref:ABC transporter permease subunit n=1 Tax=Mycoplasmopsis opalescens TaxID=114886 RepID=UPI0004A6B242|nr:ABC transporter permease subunit [Mycoplasmopsis opalescens]